jgi:chemotaxis protein MotB
MAEKAKKCPPCEEGSPSWMTTYGDMVTLLLTFFVMMFTTAEIDGQELKLVVAAFNGLGMLEGGNTLSVGKLAELGNTIESLPSIDLGRALDKARKKAVSQFQPEINSKLVKITIDERGLIISLAADAYFESGSAEVNMDVARDTLFKLSSLLNSMPDRMFRVEGHTDSDPTDGINFKSNWELSAARAANILHRLSEYGANEKQFQIVGHADTQPFPNIDTSTEEGKALLRRVEVVILSDGHL